MSQPDDFLKVIKNLRRYAGFFDWPSKPRKELGIVQQLLESMEEAGEPTYSDPAPCNDQWPDVLARDDSGAVIAIEVTELVDEASIRANEMGKRQFALWTPPFVEQGIAEIVAKKDLKSNHGGRYSKVLLLIHTDEPTIEPRKYLPLIDAWKFKRPRNIAECIVLFSYDPLTRRYPYSRLAFE